MQKATIVMVPGLWEGPTVFDNIARTLSTKGYAVHVLSLPSTGTKGPDSPSMDDDIASIRGAIEPLVNAGRTIVLVLHSAGGFLGSAAIEGLTAKAREAKGESGGVARLALITAGLLEENANHEVPPFAEIRDGENHLKDYENGLFNDLEPEDRKKWMKALQSQPGHSWDRTVKYCGWREVPSVYGLCLKDQLFPKAFGRHFASLAKSDEIVEIDAGHVPMITKPDDCIRLIEGAAAKV